MSDVTPIDNIRGYHAHIYFDKDTLALAQQLCENTAELFEVEVGRVHQKLVGPHPCWSCQLAFSPQQFSAVVPWLALNRAGLTVFVHPQTGDDLRDHRDYAMWMGTIEKLDFSIFTQ